MVNQSQGICLYRLVVIPVTLCTSDDVKPIPHFCWVVTDPSGHFGDRDKTVVFSTDEQTVMSFT